MCNNGCCNNYYNEAMRLTQLNYELSRKQDELEEYIKKLEKKIMNKKFKIIKKIYFIKGINRQMRDQTDNLCFRNIDNARKRCQNLCHLEDWIITEIEEKICNDWLEV